MFKSITDWEEIYLTFNEAYSEVNHARCAKGGNLVGTQMYKMLNDDKGITDFVWNHGSDILENADQPLHAKSKAAQNALDSKLNY